MNNLFIREMRLRRNEIKNFDEYPFNIPIIRDMTEIRFEKPVTFIVGANGSGKSTVIEALAVAMGLSAEGGTRNMSYQTVNTTSELCEHLTLVKSGILPKWKFFLRAESFYTMANAYLGYEINMHECSHGEAFNRLFDEFSENGLYLMDEPESALSPQNQMRLLTRMHHLAQNGTQFIVVTHSPILMSYFDAQILNADDYLRPIQFKDTEIYSIYRRFLECPERMQHYLFEE